MTPSTSGPLPITDADRIDALEHLFRNCPHSEIIFNDDPDCDEPVGFTIRVSGCVTTEFTSPTLRGAMDGEVELLRAHNEATRAPASSSDPLCPCGRPLSAHSPSRLCPAMVPSFDRWAKTAFTPATLTEKGGDEPCAIQNLTTSPKHGLEEVASSAAPVQKSDPSAGAAEWRMLEVGKRTTKYDEYRFNHDSERWFRCDVEWTVNVSDYGLFRRRGATATPDHYTRVIDGPVTIKEPLPPPPKGPKYHKLESPSHPITQQWFIDLLGHIERIKDGEELATPFWRELCELIRSPVVPPTSLEELARDAAGMLVKLPIGALFAERESIILSALTRAVEAKEREECLACRDEVDRRARMPSMIHAGEYKCLECGNSYCPEHARSHFTGNKMDRLGCQSFEIATEALVVLQAEATNIRAQLTAQAADMAKVEKERDYLKAEVGKVMDALGNGVDDELWPPGITAVDALIADRARLGAVVGKKDAAMTDALALLKSQHTLLVAAHVHINWTHNDAILDRIEQALLEIMPDRADG